MQSHVEWVKQNGLLYEIAVLAVGGALKASELALQGEPAFGLIRPPGHHASPNSCWEFCYFNNVAVAIEKLRREDVIEKALIVGIDLRYGDGTAHFFASVPEVVYHHVDGVDRTSFLSDLERFLSLLKNHDVVAVSAGFDRHEFDWGGLLRTEDYAAIGKNVKEYADEKCDGRVFAVLKGGYNHNVLGKNVKALLLGLE